MNNTPTPRTDARYIEVQMQDLQTGQQLSELFKHARQLERELNEVRDERDKLKKVLDGFSNYQVFETKTK